MKIMTTAATLAALLVSAGTAMAAPAIHPAAARTAQPAMTQRTQKLSNENIRIARRHVERAIDGLQRDATDYGGHKELAIDDLQSARQDLDAALDFAATHGEGAGTGAVLPGGNNDRGVSNDIDNQAASNESITDVRQHVETAIDALQRDDRDYNGKKVAAIDKLRAARAQLDAALDFAHNRGVRTGSTGPAVSDSNLRFVDTHVRAAIDSLQEDRHDYGGHRANAVSDLETAASDIASALSFDRRGEPGTSAMPGRVNEPAETGAMTQRTSNASLMAARTHTESALDALSRDAHDYGGFRVKAMASLRAAREQILLALQFQRTH